MNAIRMSCRLAVLAAATPGDCFDCAVEAVRLATRYMTPVILLSDAFLANAAEPWRLPDLNALPRFPVRFRTVTEGFHPFVRDPVTLARAWAVPGKEWRWADSASIAGRGSGATVSGGRGGRAGERAAASARCRLCGRCADGRDL